MTAADSAGNSGAVNRAQYIQNLKTQGFTGPEARQIYNTAASLDGNREQLSPAESTFMQGAIQQAGPAKIKDMLAIGVPLEAKQKLKAEYQKTFGTAEQPTPYAELVSQTSTQGQTPGTSTDMAGLLAKELGLSEQNARTTLSHFSSDTLKSLYQTASNLDPGGKPNQLDPSEKETLQYLAQKFEASPVKGKVAQAFETGNVGGTTPQVALKAIYDGLHPAPASGIFASRSLQSPALAAADHFFKTGEPWTAGSVARHNGYYQRSSASDIISGRDRNSASGILANRDRY